MSNWIILLITGLISLVGGVLALANPFGASLVVTVLAGWIFIIAGILQIVAGIRAEGWGGKIWAFLLGVVALVLGVNLIGKPLEGMVALTVVVGVLFLTSGVFKIIGGFSIPDKSIKLAVIISGVVSLVLGVMVFNNFPQSAAIILGVLLAVELLSNGIAAIALALSRKSTEA